MERTINELHQQYQLLDMTNTTTTKKGRKAFLFVKIKYTFKFMKSHVFAAIAQLGERQTEDLKVPGSIPGCGTFFFSNQLPVLSRLAKVLRGKVLF